VRIIAGSWRGRSLIAPPDDRIRPTSDRVKGAIFNILAHGIEGVQLDGARVIDLFAGTGALGFEALSRGAAHCVFVENDAEARGLLTRNIALLDFAARCEVLSVDATRLGSARGRQPFTLAFLDPPYGKGLGERTLAALATGAWLAPDAVVVLEESAGTKIAWPTGYDGLDVRRWGDTQAAFARYRGH
jgi:16S rRNA (guanine966-N2)-methyltransferase